MEEASQAENSDSLRISQLVTNVERPKRLERFKRLALFDRLSRLPAPFGIYQRQEKTFRLRGKVDP